MFRLDACWTYLVHVLNLLTLNSFDSYDNIQTPINAGQQHLGIKPVRPTYDYPIFQPPNPPEDWNSRFVCEYPDLPDYEACDTSNHDERGCWLKPKDPASGLPEYNIFTDYENIYPPGIKRKYTLDISKMTLSPDGCENKEGKVFNATYPGPWIEACWGDEIEVTVTNSLPCNGTTIHWHGIRQLNTVEMDGVNAITQCPVAPGASFTYKFRGQQYGSSWYHSHYSLQRSAFEDWAWSLPINLDRPQPMMTSILLNGNGTFMSYPGTTCTNPQPRTLYTKHFQRGVRYLLRLINTSVDSAFVFSIDGHNLTVIQADFVPIHNYTTNNDLIGIGQRYHVVVEANPDPDHLAPDGNYWIRTIPADGCSKFHKVDNITLVNPTTGIIRYNAESTDDPTSTQNVPMPVDCSDEPYESLKPILEWNVPEKTIEMNFTVSLENTTDPPYHPNHKMRFQIAKGPMWLNYSAPTLTHLDTAATDQYAQVALPNTHESEEVPWVEFLISAVDIHNSTKKGVFPAVAHPIHLHGHDFALLAVSNQTYDKATANVTRKNPPRRDVVLLPAGGYIIIAFKMDNPGVWLIHCHIAWHASSGLAMQVLENMDKVKLIDRWQLEDTCRKWDVWYTGERLERQCKTNIPFQDDSGI